MQYLPIIRKDSSTVPLWDLPERDLLSQGKLKKPDPQFYGQQHSCPMNSFHKLIGRSRQMRNLFTLLQQVAGVDTTLLITGETGTGKELVAEALHAISPRRKGPKIKVNCLALVENLLDSELFGHVRGAFTGAHTDRTGRVEAAQNGTLFLDEIGDLSQHIQLKLLRFLQEKEYERVGESKTSKADVRIVAATNADLVRKVAEGSFRKDLYYRLKVVNIHMPRLRERAGDIPLLVDHFCRLYAEKFKKPVQGVSPEAMRILLDYPWPGNVRQLEHALEHGVLLCSEEMVEPEHLPEEILEHNAGARHQQDSGAAEREKLVCALEAALGKKAEAARLLGVSRRTIYRKLHRYGLF